MSIDPTSPTTDTNEILTVLGEGIALSDEQEALELAEEQRRRKTELGDITKLLVKLDADARKRLISFLRSDCYVPTDDQLTQQVQTLQQQNAVLHEENDELKRKVSDLGGDNVTTFKNAGEKAKAEFILDQFRNGNGNYQDNQTVLNRLKPQQPKQQKQGPTGPPTEQQPTANPSDTDDETSGDSKPSMTRQATTKVTSWLKGQ